MAPVIEANRLSKKYELGTYRSREDSLREVLMHSLRTSWRTLRRGAFASQNSSGPQWIWALRDVSFSVEPGDVVGIIGVNGAGKSTLLKILSRITDPTEGYVRLRGRVASLLEVGTGFHPDLTGRENILLNGVMLGMTKAEVQSKFDEIVAFSELEKFLDTPVKHYSSGMYVRLGFAVAAHLDPEILIVDEVLAVGDMAFQRKCLGKMGEFGESGRTILFVSHNIAAVLNLCQKGILLDQGRLTFEGDAKSTVEHYVGTFSFADPNKETHITNLVHARGRAAKFQPWLRKLELYTSEGNPLREEIAIGSRIRFHLEFDLQRPTAIFDVRVNFLSLYGQVIFAARSSYEQNRMWGERCGKQQIVCEIPKLPLTPGEYRIDVALMIEGKLVDYVDDACRLKIVGSDFYGTGTIPSVGFFVHRQHWWLE